jgi:hypothetical protein
MLKKILVALSLITAGLCIYAAVKPAHMSVSREVVLNASAETIFPYINNAQKADDWMPWKDSDPTVQMTYAGPAEGVGSKSTWDSKGDMGTGEALVTESIPNQTVKTQLTYTKPFQMTQMAEIALTPTEGGTKVRWTVSGQNPFFFRLMRIFINCDTMIGKEFEKGLAKLKSKVEQPQ